MKNTQNAIIWMELNPFQNSVSREAIALRGVLSVPCTTQAWLKAIKSTCHSLQGWSLMWPLCSRSRAGGDSWGTARACDRWTCYITVQSHTLFKKKQFHPGPAASQTQLRQACLAAGDNSKAEIAKRTFSSPSEFNSSSWLFLPANAPHTGCGAGSWALYWHGD